MVRWFNLNNGKARLSIVLVAYFSLSLSLLFFKGFRYLIDPDVTSYISITQKYLKGDYTHAVNGYWSPLVSWMAIPLLWEKVRPIVAFALEAIIVGGFTLAGINLLLSAIKVRDYIIFFYLLALSPLIAWYALTEGNPDLLCLCILIYYLYVIAREDFNTNKHVGIYAGILGAISYLAKSYNFYFFIIHYTIVTMLYLYNSSDRNQRKTILINGLSGMLVFLLISSIWIAFLSHKYHHVTVSTAGNYNLSLIRPDSSGHPMETGGLQPLPNKTAISSWEDPTYLQNTAWSPFKSTNDFKYFIKNIVQNATVYLLLISENHVLFITVICFITLLTGMIINTKDIVFLYFITAIIHPLGYLAIFLEKRYIWIDYILFYTISAYLLELFITKTNFTKIQKIFVSIIIFSYIISLPIIQSINKEYAINKLRHIYETSTDIKKYYNLSNKRIASQNDNWFDDLYLSYYLKSRYLGKVKEDIPDPLLKKKLIELNIDYYFVHGKLENHLTILKSEGKFGDLTIYKVVLPRTYPDKSNSKTSTG